MLFGSRTKDMVERESALKGRPARVFDVPATHAVLGTPLPGGWPAGTQVASFALGCFWGAERVFWQTPGVVATAAGYQGGYTPNPTYEEVCTGRTGHAETVLVAYDPDRVTFAQLLKVFWESHDPTQGMRQGNDLGTQYRSAIYATTAAQLAEARASLDTYQKVLRDGGFGEITTEVRAADEAGPFYLAEAHHQQYLHKVPGGYCGLSGTGVSCPVGLAPAASDERPAS